MKTKRAFLAAATIMLFLVFGSAAALKSTKAVHLRSLGVSQTHSKLKDNDLIELRCMGRTGPTQNTGDRIWLEGQTESTTVGLLTERNPDRTLWLVRKLSGDGVNEFHLMSMSLNMSKGYRWLEGNAVTGRVSLTNNPTGFSGAKWKVHYHPDFSSNGVITLESLSNVPGKKWLNGYVNYGSVDVQNVAQGLTGTQWEVVSSTMRDGLVLMPDMPNGGVWLVQNGQRRLFPSLTTATEWVNTHGIAERSIERDVLFALPMGPDVATYIPPDGTLIGRTNGRPGIWRMEGGKKRLFPDLCSLKALIGGGIVKTVDDFVFDRIPDGAVYPTQACPHNGSGGSGSGGGLTIRFNNNWGRLYVYYTIALNGATIDCGGFTNDGVLNKGETRSFFVPNNSSAWFRFQESTQGAGCPSQYNKYETRAFGTSQSQSQTVVLQ